MFPTLYFSNRCYNWMIQTPDNGFDVVTNWHLLGTLSSFKVKKLYLLLQSFTSALHQKLNPSALVQEFRPQTLYWLTANGCFSVHCDIHALNGELITEVRKKPLSSVILSSISKLEVTIFHRSSSSSNDCFPDMSSNIIFRAGGPIHEDQILDYAPWISQSHHQLTDKW